MNFQRYSIAEIKELLAGKNSLSEAEMEALKSDRRKGAVLLLQRFELKQKRILAEEERLEALFEEEKACWQDGYSLVAGVDEAGRGPLAGPVVAAAVIFEPQTRLFGVNDSKKLTSAIREELFNRIVENAASSAIASASREEIDSINIHAATLLAMKRALEQLSIKPAFVLVDGFPIRGCPFKQKAIRGGDAASFSIAAASILAKVARDRIMLKLHKRYPGYGFDRNKGYGTAEHISAIRRYGPCPEHRRSFSF